VIYELGAPFLYVNGHCQYWCGSWNGEDRLQQWRPLHTGMLSPTREATLTRIVRYDRIGALQMDCEPDQFSDQPLVTISDGAAAARCARPTREFMAALTELYPFVQNLYEAGLNEVHGMRVEVGAQSFPVTKVPPHAWPITRPVTDFVVSETMEFEAGHSILVTDDGSVTALRQLRSQFITEQEPLDPTEPGVPIDGSYVLYMRDEIPLSNAAGLTHFGPTQ
jgi:hypothetical protein